MHNYDKNNAGGCACTEAAGLWELCTFCSVWLCTEKCSKKVYFKSITKDPKKFVIKNGLILKIEAGHFSMKNNRLKSFV